MSSKKTRDEKKPIFIMGFGRSGTTWVSDIVSKSLGGLILFEPFHPTVLSNALDLMYSRGSKKSFEQVSKYLNTVFQGGKQDRWLLRNHLSQELDYSDELFEANIWQECSILGSKEIRLNLMLEKFRKEGTQKIIFVVRHPLAVLASIKKRDRFWLEFGFDAHYNKFLQETFYNPFYRDAAIQEKSYWINKCKSDLEKAALMWAVTHEIIFDDLASNDVYMVDYDKLYDEPYNESRKLLAFLGYVDIDLHPVYLFTPSMTTHKTLHGSKDIDKYKSSLGACFWEGVLTNDEIVKLTDILTAFHCPIKYYYPFN